MPPLWLRDARHHAPFSLDPEPSSLNPEPAILPPAQRIWHRYDSHGQILALTFS